MANPAAPDADDAGGVADDGALRTLAAKVHEMPGAAWEKVIAINLSAPFYAIKETIPYMYKKGWGRIINVASTQGLVGSVNKAPYNASKHGLVGMTKTIALEAAETGVTCNAVCPGWSVKIRQVKPN